MKRIKTVCAKGRSFKVTIKIEASTKWLVRNEAETLINRLADDAMNSLVHMPYCSTSLSKIKVK